MRRLFVACLIVLASQSVSTSADSSKVRIGPHADPAGQPLTAGLDPDSAEVRSKLTGLACPVVQMPQIGPHADPFGLAPQGGDLVRLVSCSAD